jgi:arsenate reductase-like glutaredoxin family protein
MAPGEIRRFVEKFTLAGLLDPEGKPYIDAGLKYLRVGETDLLARIEKEPKLLCLPLVRSGKFFSIGHDETAWKSMVAELQAAGPAKR